MIRILKTAFDTLKETFSNWNEDKGARLGAALAFYTVLSLPPLVMFATGLAGLAFGHSGGKEEILEEVRSLAGTQAETALRSVIEAPRSKKAGTLATLVGVVTILFGAAGVFGQLRDAIDTIWEVKRRSGLGVFGLLRDRLLTFAVFLIIAFLLLVALVISAGLDWFGHAMTRAFPALGILTTMLDVAVSFVVVGALFASIYKVLPSVEVRWRDVLVGAALSSVLFGVGKFLISFYIGRSSTVTAYGASGALLIILLWVYYSAQILLFGAEFTQVFVNRRGEPVNLRRSAVPVTREARAQQGLDQPEGAAPGRRRRGGSPSRARSRS